MKGDLPTRTGCVLLAIAAVVLYLVVLWLCRQLPVLDDQGHQLDPPPAR